MTADNAAMKIPLAELYGAGAAAGARERARELLRQLRENKGPDNGRLFSCPGRTELGGNHTDHNHGKIIAGAVELDHLAAAAPVPGPWAEIISGGFPKPFRIDLGSLDPRSEERGTTEALVRGVAAGFAERGFAIGGFRAVVDGRVKPGSGLSSSAAFEVLVGSILNGLFNEGKAGPLELAKIGRFAENRFFGKPSGLMDQLACAEGGIIAADFRDPEEPVTEKLRTSLGGGYTLFIVDTGGSHHDLTEDYAAIPREMKAAAACFGKETLREVSVEAFLGSLPWVREAAGDRAALRALHFFEENRRVELQTQALRRNDPEGFLSLVRESSRSSWTLLQNCRTDAKPQDQPLALALALTDRFLSGRGACRVHGGGFAGTIQAYVPSERAEEYVDFMASFFGPGRAQALAVGRRGTVEIIV